MNQCKCGCGEIIPDYDSTRHIIRQYKFNHHRRGRKTELTQEERKKMSIAIKQSWVGRRRLKWAESRLTKFLETK